ncbi:MAG: DUF5368 domain-containing protein [Pseudomonadota bacterium]
MENFDLGVVFAVLFEMMGWVLWALILLALFGLVGLGRVLLVERSISSRRLVRAEIVGVLGGFAALALMAYVTVSGFTDAGGPVDWLLIGLIWGGGLVGVTILAYAVMGLAGLYKSS